MVSETLYLMISILIVTLITWGLRAFPFLVFGKRDLPHFVRYLGYVLPSSIMAILVFYCIRNTAFTEFPFGLSELMSIFLTVLIHIKKRNTYLSIIVGTGCYMILIRLI